MSRSRFISAVVAVVVAGPLAVTVSASAADTTPATDEALIERVYGAPRATTDLSAAVTLAPRLPRADALQRAAARSLPSSADRAGVVAKLRRWAPSHAARQATAAWALERGLHVERAGRWVVLVSGPADRMAEAFDAELVAAPSPFEPNGPRAHLRASRTPNVPAELRGHANAVIGLDNRPVFRATTHVAGKEPADLRSAYRQQAGGHAGLGLTVGTVQFSWWNAGDLAVYADDKNLPNPLSRTTNVIINGGARENDGDRDFSGQDEVALDTQMILATAPRAAQRVYNAPNSAAGAIAMYAAIADDAEAGRVQAVSTSWAACEENQTSILSSLRTHIQRMVAAGATIFAASGDFGSAGCYNPGALFPDTSQRVEVPASIPEVLGVGGTALTRSGGDWREKAWGNGNLSPQQGGSGGGVSHRYGLPSYQADVPEAGNARMVPDISAVGDPATGVSSYNSANGWIVIGGTSASAPINAGLLAASLSHAGYARGIGNIHRELYDAPRSAFRDATSGDNGDYSANSGYDLVTGLGSPLWSRIIDDLGVRASSYHPRATPKRVVNTRKGTGAGIGKGKIGAHDTVRVKLPKGSVPSKATSVVLNMIVSGAGKRGRLAVQPGSYRLRSASSVSFRPKDTVATLVTAQVGDRRRIAFTNNSDGPLHLAADLYGYYRPGGSGADFKARKPLRVVDSERIDAHDGRTFTLPSSVEGAQAVVLSVTAVRPGRHARLTVWPANRDRPKRWTLDANADERSSNTVIVRVPDSRKLRVHNGGDRAVEVMADLEGHFRAKGARFHARAPLTVLDTRDGTGGVGTTRVKGDGSRTFELPAAVRGDATAVVLSVTVLKPRAGGSLTVYPRGTDRPAAWSVSFAKGRRVTGLVVAQIGSGDRIVFANRSNGSVHLTAELAGYYAP